MFVITPFQNIDHRVSGDAMHFCEGSHGHTRGCKLLSPGAHLVIREMCRWVFFALLAVTRWRGATVFGVAVQDIVGVSAEPKMSRIDATRVVTIGAIVANQKADRDGAIVKLIRNSGCLTRMWLASRPGLQLTISVLVTATLPFPTVIRATLINLFPKAFFDSAYCSGLVVMTYNKAHWLAFDMP